jgi:cellulose synthase/poly-beta-1,6-N-acetylglucosamine synthase-like glycosyltransferase
MLPGLGFLAFFVTSPSTSEKVWNALFDDTFAGVHSLAFFDYAVLIPYFTLLAILSFYGLHRFAMIKGYYQGRKNMPKQPAQRFEENNLPAVTIQLPLFNERYVVERLLESASKVRYPKDKLQVQILDDSTDDSAAYTEALVARYVARGFNMEYKHRTNRKGYKAGALEEGLATATGELTAIFDADFVIPEDFLEQTVHYFTDPQVGVVQTRWSYLNRHYNLLTEVQTMLLDGHFVLEHGARAGTGLFFNFNGTAGIMRKAMVQDAGGWQHDTLTEDSDLSYRAQLKGWRFVYLPHVHCPSELPVETYGFQVQQARWAKGLTQCAKKLLERVLRSDLSWRHKMEAFCHLTPNISYPLMIVVSALMLPVMIVRFYMGPLEVLLIDLPLIIANFASLTAFYLVAQRELDPRNWKRTIWFMPALMAAQQYEGRPRSPLRRPDRFRPHRQIQHRREETEAHPGSIQTQKRNLAFPRNRDGHCLRRHGLLLHRELELPQHPLPDDLRQRLLLGRLLHALAGIPRPARIQGRRAPSRQGHAGSLVTPHAPRPHGFLSGGQHRAVPAVQVARRSSDGAIARRRPLRRTRRRVELHRHHRQTSGGQHEKPLDRFSRNRRRKTLAQSR